MSRPRPDQRAADATKIRSFLAFDLSATVMEAIARLQRQLAATSADVRWTRPEGMHVTLKFLGAVEPSLLERARVALTDALHAQPALDVSARGLGAFPSLRRPRVLWVGLQGTGLGALARGIDEVFASLGFAPEQRAFTAHITLGRVNSPREWPQLEALMVAHREDTFGACTVDAVSMYRSQLQRGGSVYTKLWTVPLQHAKGADHGT